MLYAYSYYSDIDVVCLFMLFTSCAQVHKKTHNFIIRAQHLWNGMLSLNNTYLWYNRFCMDLERIHEACKFVITFVGGMSQIFDAYHD
jgi:hypothetical protein